MNQQTIFIADDDSDLVELLARRCRSLGFAVDTASDAMTALKKIDQVRPDLAILDVNMPGGNGLSVREMMADNEQLASVPVIILTGKVDEQILRRCFTSCAYYVAKCPDVWPRIEPLLFEILGGDVKGGDGKGGDGTCGNVRGGDSENGGSSDVARDAAKKSNPYEDSDQKVFFDWIFDMFAQPDQDETESFLPDSTVAESSSPTVQDPWVLCIDDDSEFTFLLQMRLQEHGVNVLRAFSGMEGFRSAFFSRPQAVILDFEMPDGNGDYVLRRLKETPLTRETPVIVLTGRKDHTVERQMYALGADEFLTKPCSWDKLWPILQHYLELPVA
ncbi:MAG: response regulator [Planctomycetaceae bacterium]